MDRRNFIAATCSVVGMSAIAMPALAQAKTKVRVGYLHTLAVDGQIWLAHHLARRTAQYAGILPTHLLEFLTHGSGAVVRGNERTVRPRSYRRARRTRHRGR